MRKMYTEEDAEVRCDHAAGPQRCNICDLLRPNDAAEHKKARGRRYIPHGHGVEVPYRMHIKHIEPKLTECDLDWKSRLRWLPQPCYSNAPFPEIKMIKFPNDTRLLKYFPNANMSSGSEWTFYPSFGLPTTYHVGKKCLIDGTHHYRSLGSCSERTLELALGRKKQVRSVCCMLPGSKSYISPEYSNNFYKMGATLPTVGFGSSATLKGDTFIPLQYPTAPQCMTYHQNKKRQEREADIVEVRKLDEWKPALPISPPLPDNRHGKFKKPDTLRRVLQGRSLASSISALSRTL